MKKLKPKYNSIISLIAVNLFPVYGVLFLGWDVFVVMLLFWSENVILGIYNVFKMITCDPEEKTSWITKLFMIPFFIVHYGGFTFGHGVFVISIFGEQIFQNTTGPRLDVLLQIIHENNLIFAMLAIFLSHGYSFITNYLGKGEYRKYTIATLMMQPYSRVIILHITLIIGAFLIFMFKSTTAFLLLFIFLKIGMDLRAHLKERKISD